MDKEFSVEKLLNLTKSVDKFGEIYVLSELVRRGFDVEWHGSRERFDIKAEDYEIEVKSCNYDNNWAKNRNLIGGFDRIDPSKFDYLVCVSFNSEFKDVRCFIFTKTEVKKFVDAVWENAVGKKTLNLVRNDKKSNKLIDASENKWDKIIRK